jgi:Saxitoxin biosynthesis operon protein SxtJ
MTGKPLENSQIRMFGILVGGVSAAIGLVPIALGGQRLWVWPIALGVGLFTSGLIYPEIFRPLFRAWRAVGEFIPRVNTRIILALLFYMVIVPIGFVMRVARKDLMPARFDPNAKTYRVPRTKRPASHMQRQY